MIKKIICPTDFSAAANNALEYGAKLAQVFNAELMLINIERMQPVADVVGLGPGIGANAEANAKFSSDRLEEMSVVVNKTFHISSTYEVDITAESLSKAIASHGDSGSLIVMGTNGVDNLSQFLFGTNTYKVIRKAECPVLLVPENYSFESYTHIVFVFTYQENRHLALKALNEFVKQFDSKITFLHVSKNDTEISRDVFRSVRMEVEQSFKDETRLDYKRIYSEDSAEGIEDFIMNNPTDLLVMAWHQPNVIERLFRKAPFLSRLSATTTCPILIFHS